MKLDSKHQFITEDWSPSMINALRTAAQIKRNKGMKAHGLLCLTGCDVISVAGKEDRYSYVGLQPVYIIIYNICSFSFIFVNKIVVTFIRSKACPKKKQLAPLQNVWEKYKYYLFLCLSTSVLGQIWYAWQESDSNTKTNEVPPDSSKFLLLTNKNQFRMHSCT